MTALVTAVLAVAARIIARIAFAAGSREKPAPAATAAPAHPAFSSAAVAGPGPAVTRTGVARIAVRPGSRAGSRPLRRGTRHRLAGRALARRHRTASGPGNVQRSCLSAPSPPARGSGHASARPEDPASPVARQIMPFAGASLMQVAQQDIRQLTDI
jgi:hypothetical protein